jgi:hypothetical protein
MRGLEEARQHCEINVVAECQGCTCLEQIQMSHEESELLLADARARDDAAEVGENRR